MALLNASGAPVATQCHTMQIDVPCEAVANVSAIDFGKVFAAVLQLFTAYATGDPAKIIAAIQALIAAFLGG